MDVFSLFPGPIKIVCQDKDVQTLEDVSVIMVRAYCPICNNGLRFGRNMVL